MKRWNLVITGFGTVGRQVARLLEQRKERYRKQYGADVRLVGVARSAMACYDPEGLSPEKWETFGSQGAENRPPLTGMDLVATGSADVLIEAGPSDFVTGGAGLSYMREALGRGMHVIAVSKGALVVDYAGLATLAKQQGVSLKISGATAAALPTIDLFRYNLAGCEVAAVEGIFTGTANFVLTCMLQEGLSLEEATFRAQQMGIAEPDPSFDLEGWDSACKVTILANAAFDARMGLCDVARTGITGLAAEEISRWKQAGKVPKLIGSIRRTANGVEASVSVQAVDHSHPFASVQGTTKAIRIETDVMGEMLVIGGKSDPVAAAAAALKDLEHILGR